MEEANGPAAAHDDQVNGWNDQIRGDFLEDWLMENEDGDSHSDDDEEDVSSDERDDFCDITEQRLHLVKRNDPRIKQLLMPWSLEDDYFCSSIDWVTNSCHIGSNTHLRRLVILGPDGDGDDLDRPGIRDNFYGMCRGLANNRSIKCLEIAGCSLMQRDAFVILSPFFENNFKLAEIEISACENMNSEGIQLLASALAGCKENSLEKLCLPANRFDDDSAGQILAALIGHRKLTQLDIGGNSLGRKGCTALKDLLQNHSTPLAELDLSRIPIGDACASILASGLASCNTLKKILLLGETSMNHNGWKAISTALLRKNSPIEHIDLGYSDICNGGALALAGALSKHSTLKILNLRQCQLISPMGWHFFFNQLRGSSLLLDKLDLSGNSINDGTIPAMLFALHDMTKLKSLCIERNRLITSRGWQIFSQLLQSRTSVLEELVIRHNRFDERAIVAFVDAIASNDTLTIWHFDYENIRTNNGWLALSGVLCDKSDINHTSSSNHTLEDIAHETESIPFGIVASLTLNKNPNKDKVAYKKILRTHFILNNGKVHVEEFVDMKWGVLPYCISWIGRYNIGLNLMFVLAQNMPLLFEKRNSPRLERKRRRNHYMA